MRNVLDYISEENYIAHHGIKGQKWGVRRYQNEDGTLTDAGKKRYSISGDVKKAAAELGRLEKIPFKEAIKMDGHYDKKQKALSYIRDHDPIISTAIKNAKKEALKLDKEHSDEQAEQISKNVNSIMKTAFHRYENILKEAGYGAKLWSSYDPVFGYDIDEDLWLQIPNFGY